jgi:hypothetical protein
VLIGCILFTVGTIGIHSIYVSGEKSRYFASQHVKAVYLAKGIINELEAKGFDRIELYNDAGIKNDGYSCKVITGPSSFPGTKDSKQVSVEVLYDAQGKKQSVVLTSLFFKEAPHNEE